MKFARAKGLTNRRVIGVHVLKNILIPIVTVIGLELGSVIAFAIVTESIFAWPGTGKLLIDSINQLDRPVIVAYLLVIVFQIVFSILGAIVVCWFSRQREFRADAGGARLAGRENMINALRTLGRLYDPEVAAAEAKHAQAFQSLKISGKPGGFMSLLSTHPPIEERIARLEQGVA